MEKIEKIIPGLEKEKISETITELMEEYNKMEHKGIKVIEIANEFQMCTKKPYEQSKSKEEKIKKSKKLWGGN